MNLVFEDKNKRTIGEKEEIVFSSFSSFHLISITARAKGEKQLNPAATNDEDLIVEIDGKTFPKLGTKNDLIDSPASFNGGKLHGLAQTIYFLTFLKGRNHEVVLTAKTEPNTAELESIEIRAITLGRSFSLKVNNQAEDGDRRPWVTYVLDDLSLFSVSPTLTYSRRKGDSDDVKIIIDGQAQKNLSGSIKYRFWKWVGSFLARISSTVTTAETFYMNFPIGTHFVEFDADRMPVLESISFDFGKIPIIPNVVPTVDNPKWTEEFSDDTTEILLARLIFGEAENQPAEAKIGVGFTVINRFKKQKSGWGLTVRDIILKDSQYDGLWNVNTSDKVRDPLSKATEKRKKEWQESYRIARAILIGSVMDTSLGATSFHSYKRKEEFPPWAQDRYYKIKLGDIYFYELES